MWTVYFENCVKNLKFAQSLLDFTQQIWKLEAIDLNCDIKYIMIRWTLSTERPQFSCIQKYHRLHNECMEQHSKKTSTKVVQAFLVNMAYYSWIF